MVLSELVAAIGRDLAEAQSLHEEADARLEAALHKLRALSDHCGPPPDGLEDGTPYRGG